MQRCARKAESSLDTRFASVKCQRTTSPISPGALPREPASARSTRIKESATFSRRPSRPSTPHALYWLFVALLLGAFSASVAATFGGKQRDLAHIHEHPLEPPR